MPKDTTSTEYKMGLLSRVKSLREGMRHPDGKFWTAEDMAKALRVSAETYRKYESRTPLPHELIEPFSLVVGCTVEYLVTGNKPINIATARYHRHAADSSKAADKRASK